MPTKESLSYIRDRQLILSLIALIYVPLNLNKVTVSSRECANSILIVASVE
jgi:hypothetical protein